MGESLDQKSINWRSPCASAKLLVTVCLYTARSQFYLQRFGSHPISIFFRKLTLFRMGLFSFAIKNTRYFFYRVKIEATPSANIPGSTISARKGCCHAGPSKVQVQSLPPRMNTCSFIAQSPESFLERIGSTSASYMRQSRGRVAQVWPVR